VDDFRDVTSELLGAAFDRIGVPVDPPVEMTSDFWAGKIFNARKRLAGCEVMWWGKWGLESAAYGMGMLRRRLLPAG